MSLAKFTLAAAFALVAIPAFADAPPSDFDMAPPAEQAEGASMLHDATATRLSDTQVQIKFTVDGGACQAIDTPETTATADTLAVVFPSRDTAEICTMQIVLIPVDVTVDAAVAIKKVDLSLKAANGDVLPLGKLMVER
ncbi:hypothetical protein [Devosia sp. 2618]|uniref:hypothetical protein n=1 Tax=Devosia sp. 2618 TaxID=3156454 RepID=UPI0033958CD2